MIPDVLVIDQIRNVQVKEDNFVRHLEKVSAMIRQIGQRHEVLVISVTQAGDSATNKAALEMGDVDNSNTGMPGQADVMLGIGGTEADVRANRRVLSLPKNKRSGNHDFFTVEVDPVLNKIRSM